MVNHSDKILVTGAHGFTGRYVIPLLRAQGAEVVGLVEGATTSDGEIRADLSDAEQVRAAVHQVKPTRVLHLAAISRVDDDNVRRMYAVNAEGTRYLLDALGSLQVPPAQVVLASTSNVYGEVRSGRPIREEQPFAPKSHYASSKMATEGLASVFRSQFPILVTRPFNYTGPAQNPHFLVSKIAAHFALHRTSIELGNLDVSRDFSDVRDVAHFYVKLLGSASGADQPHVVNICSGVGTSLMEIVETLKGLTGLSPEIRVNPRFVRSNEIPVLLGDDTRLQEMIGPLSRRSLRDTLADMLKHFEIHPPEL